MICDDKLFLKDQLTVHKMVLKEHLTPNILEKGK